MSYEVKANATEVAIHSGETQAVSFTVNNTSNLSLLTLTQVHTRGSVEKAWCTLKPGEDTTIDANGNHVFELTIAPQGVKKPTSGHVSLQAAWVDDPSNVCATSSEVAVTLLQPTKVLTWWQRHGTKVIAGAAGVLVLCSIPFFIPDAKAGSISSFEASPLELKVGETTTFSWKVGGEPEGLTLELSGEEPTHLDSLSWAEGQIEYIPVREGALSARLAALYPGEGEDAIPTEIAQQLELEVTPADRVFVAPSVTSFTLGSTSLKAGDPAVFSWAVAGDVAGLQLITDGNSLSINDSTQWSTGTHQSLQIAGQHEASLLVSGMDGSQVNSQTLSFTVQENVAVQQPTVSFTVGASGSVRNIEGLFARVELKWSVGEPHKSVELLHGATRVAVSAKGTKKLGATKKGTKITLLVTLTNGQIMAHDRVVGQTGRIFNPKLLDSRAILSNPNLRGVVPN